MENSIYPHLLAWLPVYTLKGSGIERYQMLRKVIRHSIYRENLLLKDVPPDDTFRLAHPKEFLLIKKDDRAIVESIGFKIDAAEYKDEDHLPIMDLITHEFMRQDFYTYQVCENTVNKEMIDSSLLLPQGFRIITFGYSAAKRMECLENRLHYSILNADFLEKGKSLSIKLFALKPNLCQAVCLLSKTIAFQDLIALGEDILGAIADIIVLENEYGGPYELVLSELLDNSLTIKSPGYVE